MRVPATPRAETRVGANLEATPRRRNEERDELAVENGGRIEGNAG
jgi:hypothetical protein